MFRQDRIGAASAMRSADADRATLLLRITAILPWSIALVTVLFVASDDWLSTQNGTGGPAQLVQLTTLGSAVIGGLLASRRPQNPVGWILCAIGLGASFAPLVWDYGFHAVVTAPGSAVLGVQALWLGAWIWIPIVGLGLPALTLRLPNGHAGRAWRRIEWLALAGTAALVLAIALAPGALDRRTNARNPFAIEGAATLLTGLRWVGYAMVATVVVASAASLVLRMRNAHGDEHEQMKWIASAGALMAFALAYGFIGQVFLDQVLFSALVPFLLVTVTLPIAIGVAVLKYRLYDINLIINRALVYGALTASLAGLYALSIALSQTLVSVSGQRSDAAILVTAFIGATAFTPVKGWLQTIVDKRFATSDLAGDVNSFRERIDAVVNTLDPPRMARRMVDYLAATANAGFVSLSLERDGQMAPFYSSGNQAGEPALTVALRSRGMDIGLLSLGNRHSGLTYTEQDIKALDECADAIAEAIVLWGIDRLDSNFAPTGARTQARLSG